MFVFYDIEYLYLLHKLQQLQIIAEDGYEVFVPILQLENYSGDVKLDVQHCHDEGYLKLISNDGFESFLQRNILNDSFFGLGFLFQLHCCIENNLVLVIDSHNISQLRLCENLGVKTTTIKEFTKTVIRNEQYYHFLMSNKDKVII